MVDGHLSSPLNIPPCGVPQGSIGGPILWLLYTCDQPDVVHEHPVVRQSADRGCGEHLVDGGGGEGQDGDVHDQQSVQCGVLVGYVDDGAYSYAHDNPAILSDILSSKYGKLAEWMNANKLVINADKTHLMVMGKRNSEQKRKQVYMMAGEFLVKPSQTEKLLGGQLHQSLDWSYHIRGSKGSLLQQLTGRIAGLRKVCKNGSFKTRLMVANGAVMSKLGYLITLWGGASESLLRAVQVQQLVAARLVVGYGCWRWSRRKLLARVGWLSVKQLVVYHTVLQVCKTLESGVPRALYLALSDKYPRNTRNAARGQIRNSEIFTSKATFKYRAMQWYNSVPSEVRAGSAPTVKKKLKKWISSSIPID